MSNISDTANTSNIYQLIPLARNAIQKCFQNRDIDSMFLWDIQETCKNLRAVQDLLKNYPIGGKYIFSAMFAQQVQAYVENNMEEKE